MSEDDPRAAALASLARAGAGGPLGPTGRREFDPASLGRAVYPLLNSVVVPRPIAWVSSRSAAGVDNLAPHSYFTVASVDPAVVQFTSVGTKDSLRNIRQTGQFVVSVVTRALAEAANLTGADFPPGESEFDAAGLTREPAALVAPPRLAESPVSIECELAGEQAFGSCTVVFGRVLRIAVRPQVLAGALVDIRRLDPVARLGADDWGALGEVFELVRVRYADWSGR